MSRARNLSYYRNGKHWTIAECLRLEREYDLLKLSVDEIAVRHNRSPNAIMFKLDQECLANYNELSIKNHVHKINKINETTTANIICDEEEDTNSNTEVIELKNRVDCLTKQVQLLLEMFPKKNNSISYNLW